jgi:hypothetical protein
MGTGGDAPEDPNFQGPIRGFRRGAKNARRRANKHYQWAKKQNRKNWQVAKPIIRNMQDMMNDQKANADEDRARYNDVFVPWQNKLMNEDIPGYQAKVDDFSNSVKKLKADAEAYGSEANKGFMMGRAVSGVADSFEKARENVLGNLESHGINPGATRYAAMDFGVRTAEAAAKAAAGTKMGLDVDETSRSMYNEALTREAQARGLDLGVLGLKGDMSNLGQTINSQAIAETGLAGTLGQAAVGAQNATSDLANKQRLSANEYMKTLNESLGGWADTIDKGYDDALESYKAEQTASSGIGGIIGAVTPLVTKFLDEGGDVPPEASPSGGAIADDVSTMLTAGEFVMPVEAVQKYGWDRLDSMRRKALDWSAQENQVAAAEPAIPEETPTAFPALGTNFALT